MPMYFALSNYITRIVLVSLYINHQDLRFLLFFSSNIKVAYPCMTTSFVCVCKWEGKMNVWATMLMTSNDCVCDAIWICYDCRISIECVQDKLLITWDLPSKGKTLLKF